VTAVADSSPLVILTKVGCLDSLNRVFPRVYISNEVHYEVVVAGTGLPGASEVSKAEWIEVKSIQNPAGLLSAQRKYGLGPGEMSTLVLAKELGASPVLLDDYRARKLAKAEGIEILGSVGLLETFYLRRYLTGSSERFSAIAGTQRLYRSAIVGSSSAVPGASSALSRLTGRGPQSLASSAASLGRGFAFLLGLCPPCLC
jgi:predicted nucleic acid-binding protein